MRKRKLGSVPGMKKDVAEDPMKGIVDLSDMKTVKRAKQNVGSMAGRVKSKQRLFLKETESMLAPP